MQEPGTAETTAPMEALVNLMGAGKLQTQLSEGDQVMHLSRVSSHRRILIGLGAVPKLARLLVNLNPQQQHSAANGSLKRPEAGPADRTTELLLVALLTLVGGSSIASVSAVMSCDPDSLSNSNDRTCLEEDEWLLQNARTDLAGQPGFPSRLVQLCQCMADPVSCCKVLSEGRRTFEFIVTHEGVERPDMGLGDFGMGKLAALRSEGISSPVKSQRPCGLIVAQLHAVRLVQALCQCAQGIDACLTAGV